jgi:hypothetical protein
MLAYKLQINVAKTVEFDKTEIYADTELEGISSPSTAVQRVRMLISMTGKTHHGLTFFHQPEVEDLEKSSPKE